MPACSFCKNQYEFPRGTTVVQKDASVKYFCSSKCRKNSEMGRRSKKVKWIKKSDVMKAEKEKKEATYKTQQEAKKK
ncbi:MAG: 50S ribosomal protein L24 [archaeon]|nr:50S ribosomal protein L24 [archaeon]MCR4323638.1 50S ribosomal protein L24 [Nanoarchaeota archaeon]